MAAILIASLSLRLAGIDWDDYYHLHPDERYIVWVGTTIEFPQDWGQALDPELSTFNPFYWPPEAKSSGITVYRGEPRDFAYGHWPLYLGVATTQLLARGAEWGQHIPEGWTLLRDLLNVPGRIEYHHLLIVGRALAALFDTLTVWLVYLLGRRLFGRPAGLLAAALQGLAVVHIQSAHFFITDPFLTTTVVGAIYWMVARVQSGRARDGILAGMLVGLAVGAKFSAVMLVVPLVVALVWRRRVPAGAKGSGWRRWLSRCWLWCRRPLLELAAAMFVALLVFAITNPFALLDTSCIETVGGWTIPLLRVTVGPFEVHSCYLENIATQGAMVRGGRFIPFTFQYLGTPAYLYYLEQLGRWGLGVPLTVVAFGGLGWSIWRMLRKRASQSGEAVVLAWVIPFFLVTGSFQVKFLRYLLPLIPFLSVLGAGMLTGRRSAAQKGVRVSRLVLSAGVVGLTLLWALAFAELYRAGDHPWVSASRWLFREVPTGSRIATEHWDHALPLDLRFEDLEENVGARSYGRRELQWYYVEDRFREQSKRLPLETVLEELAESDFLVLASNRLYGVIPRMPDRLPESAAYYRLLFAGDLGFELVHVETRSMRLGPLVIRDDPFVWPGLEAPAAWDELDDGSLVLNFGPADESFTVYDHPLVLVFENREHLSASQLLSLIRP